MKKFFYFPSLFFLFLLFFASPQNSFANVFASQIKITNPDSSEFDGKFSDGSGAKISFFLNDTASSVLISIKDAQNGNEIAQIDAGPLKRGANSVEWDGSGSEEGKNYLIDITAEQPTYSNTDWTLFYDSGDINIYTRGVAVVTDQKSQNFGLIFTANDGGPLGTGIAIYNPDGSFHDPFLVAADLSSGGTFDYGTDAPLFTAIDSTGRLYVSLKDKGQIVRIDQDFSQEILIDGLTLPKGFYIEGKDEMLTIYVAADNKILRGTIGTANSLDASSMETVANFSGFFPHQIVLDDEGFLYVTLRASSDLGSDGKGIRKYDLSGNLPVTDDDAVWFLAEDRTFIANDLLMDYGADRSSAADDILYFCTRAGDGNDQDGIWRISDVNSFFPDIVRIMTEDTFYRGDENVNARATMDFDAAGNIVFMENANEHIFFLAPPAEGQTNHFTTRSPDTLQVAAPTLVNEMQKGNLPETFQLKQNFPNPFNPSTVISFNLNAAEKLSLKIYNANGKLIKILVEERNFTPGEYSFLWHGLDASGRKVPSGSYFYSVEGSGFKQSRKMTLLK